MPIRLHLHLKRLRKLQLHPQPLNQAFHLPLQIPIHIILRRLHLRVTLLPVHHQQHDHLLMPLPVQLQRLHLEPINTIVQQLPRLLQMQLKRLCELPDNSQPSARAVRDDHVLSVYIIGVCVYGGDV
jgi:hypothetical protein